ncbi:hypothetical protein K0M31_017973, partial [Melipona bicolor]
VLWEIEEHIEQQKSCCVVHVCSVKNKGITGALGAPSSFAKVYRTILSRYRAMCHPRL